MSRQKPIWGKPEELPLFKKTVYMKSDILMKNSSPKKQITLIEQHNQMLMSLKDKYNLLVEILRAEYPSESDQIELGIAIKRKAV